MRRGGVFLFVTSLPTAYAALWLGSAEPNVNAVALLFLTVLPAVGLWLAGWIIQGFANGRREDY
jgi:hypothetical protein